MVAPGGLVIAIRMAIPSDGLETINITLALPIAGRQWRGAKTVKIIKKPTLAPLVTTSVSASSMGSTSVSV